jgi:DNA-binding CsgD family transcriptional regulator
MNLASLPYDSASSSAWTLALEVAGAPRSPLWQHELADAVARAVTPELAGVFFCPLGNILEATCAMSPSDPSQIGPRLVREVFPRLQRAGLEAPNELFTPTAAGTRPEFDRFRRALLDTAGLADMLAGFLRSSDGMICGWIALFLRTGTPDRLLALQHRLDPVCRAAESSLRTTISVASTIGARFPKTSPDPLTDREREVANLAASGYSDVNIAGRLRISEATVGRHLHHVYHKLGASSRMELRDLLYVRE